MTSLQVEKMDGSGELDWPGEMVQTTKTSPEVTFSCNPLAFDFGMLTGKPRTQSTSDPAAAVLADDEAEAVTGQSEKKKKKKKHHSKKKSRSTSKRRVSVLTSALLSSLSVSGISVISL